MQNYNRFHRYNHQKATKTNSSFILYIAKCQAVYLTKVKKQIKSNEVVVLAENYQFVVQDEIQSFHWNKTQATFVVYHKINEELKNDSICFISDDLAHDVDMVYHIMKLTVEYVKNNISPDIEANIIFQMDVQASTRTAESFLIYAITNKILLLNVHGLSSQQAMGSLPVTVLGEQ